MALVKQEYTDRETIITAKNMNDIQDAILALEEGLFAVEDDRSGEAITITDAAQRGFRSLKVYGKTTQAGIPSLDTPVALVSIAAGESISIHVTGKNLFTGWIVGGINADTGADDVYTYRRRTEYLPVPADATEISVSGIPAELYNLFAFYDANKAFLSRSVATRVSGRTVEIPEGSRYFRLTVYATSTDSDTILQADALASATMLVTGKIAAHEQARQIQAATFLTPNGLHGIPVSFGGNYTDANGQQWICDEIDLKRGVYVKRVGSVVLNGSEIWYYQESNDYFYTRILDRRPATNVLCDKLSHTPLTNVGAPGWWADNADNQFFAVTGISAAGIATTVEEFKAYIAGNNLSLEYVLQNPVETPLSAEDIAAYAALHTYKDYSKVSNDRFAYMELEYIVDAKKYIDGLFAGAIVPATVE